MLKPEKNNSAMSKNLRFLFLGLLLSVQLVAQPDYCFNFEDVPLNTQYGPASGASPGDVVFTGPGTQVSLQEIVYPNGALGFFNAEIQGSGTGWLDNQFILLGNNSLVFDFSGFPDGVSQVCFDYFDGGGSENFSVNGSPLAILNFFSEIGQLSIPGIEIDLTVAGNTFLEQGRVCITGDIRSLLLGGQEFGLDNICYRPLGPIANLQAEIVGCDNAGNFDIEVDFDWLSPLTVIAFFDIFIDGQLEASNISQLDFPYLLQGVQPVTDALEFVLTLCQHNNPAVCESVILAKECPPSSGCVEFEGLGQNSYGSDAGTPPGTPFYTENELSLLLIPFQSLFWTTTYGNLVVLDAASDPAMTAASGKHLKFERINAVFDLTAYPELVDSVTVDFYYNGGAINIAANGSNILIQNSLQPGFYALAPTATLEVAFHAPNATEGQLIFRGAIQSLLIGGSGDLRIDNLCINPIAPEPELCELSNLSIQPVPCGISGSLFVQLNFDYQGVSDSFALASDFGAAIYAYSSLPLILGPLAPSNSTVYSFSIRDQGADAACMLSDTLHIVNCTGCGFEGLTVEYLGQNSNGQTLIGWDFTLNSTQGDNYYSVYFDGELYERFEWSQVPMRAPVPCPTTGNLPPVLTICSGDSSCCVSVPLVFVEPCPPACELSNMEVQASPCNPNGVFNVKLNLDFQGASDSFELWINGNATNQFYAYSDLPITLQGPFIAPTPALEFHAVDSANPNCRAAALLPPVNCSPCPGIDSVSYHLTPCTALGFYLVIDQIIVGGQNTPGVFLVTVNNLTYGPFVFTGLPVEIGPLQPNTVYQVAIHTQNTANCPYSFTVGPVDCTGNCPLQSLELIAGPDCTPNATFYRAKLRVEGAQDGDVLTVLSTMTNSSMVAVVQNGQIVVELPVPGMMVDSLLICTLSSSTATTPCCLSIALAVNCGTGCSIQSATVIGTPGCTTPNSVFYAVAYAIQGVQEGELLVVESLITGATAATAYNNGALTVQLTNTNLGYDKVRICLLQDPSNTNVPPCCIELEYDIACPPLPCPWGNIIIEPGDCQDDGTYYAHLDLTLVAPSLAGAFVVVSGDYQAEFTFASLPVQIGPFQGDGGPRTVTVYLPGTICSTTATFLAPDCGDGDCALSLNAIARPCDGDQFKVGLQVQASNPGALGYLVFANGQLSGPYPYSQSEVLFGPFAGDGSTAYNFLVLDLENPTCFAYAEVGPVDCANACAITALAVEALDCNDDGSYNLLIDLQVSNPGTDLFEVFTANGSLIGTYSLDSLPALVQGFPPSPSLIGRLKVCIPGSGVACCELAEFTLPVCLDQDSSCVSFTPFEGFVSPPNNGAQGRVPLGTENGVDIDYFIADFCNCYVRIVNEASVPFFTAADGEVLDFLSASLFFNFPATAGEVRFDYAAAINSGFIHILSGDANATAVRLDTLPFNQEILLPDGNTILKVFSPGAPATANAGRIIISGQLDSLVLVGSGLLDNLCYELIDPEVWPGDANADNIANHIDLLSVGLAYGAQGPARFVDSDNWSGFFAPDWAQSFADGHNYKHADCNGDGEVNASDRNAIEQNYGLTHGPELPFTALPGTDFDPPVFVDFPPILPDGAAFNVPIVIGSAELPVQDIYGIAFTVEFDPLVIDPAAIEITYPVSWFGQPNVNTLYIDRTYAAEGQIEIALTRTDLNNVSGFGPVAYIIGIIDDIAGLVKSDIQVSKIKAIRNNEKRIPLNALVQSFDVSQKEGPQPEDTELARGMFSVFPNPATDWVTVSSRHGLEVDELRLMNTSGALLPALQEGGNRISLEGLPAGVYILRIRSGQTLVHKKVVKQ
jgi:hypothetical protein